MGWLWTTTRRLPTSGDGVSNYKDLWQMHGEWNGANFDMHQTVLAEFHKDRSNLSKGSIYWRPKAENSMLCIAMPCYALLCYVLLCGNAVLWKLHSTKDKRHVSCPVCAFKCAAAFVLAMLFWTWHCRASGTSNREAICCCVLLCWWLKRDLMML